MNKGVGHRPTFLARIGWMFGLVVALGFSSIVTWTCYRYGVIYGGITGDPAIDCFALAALDVTKWFLPAAARFLRGRGSTVAGLACWLLDAVLICCSLYAGVTMAGYGRAPLWRSRPLPTPLSPIFGPS